jgi:hypothetical protein
MHRKTTRKQIRNTNNNIKLLWRFQKIRQEETSFRPALMGGSVFSPFHTSYDLKKTPAAFKIFFVKVKQTTWYSSLFHRLNLKADNLAHPTLQIMLFFQFRFVSDLILGQSHICSMLNFFEKHVGQFGFRGVN